MDLLLLGLNHQTAPLDLRERVVYSRPEALETLRVLKQEALVPQAMLLSTCNRTEVYAVADQESDQTTQLLDRVFYSRFPSNVRHDGIVYTRSNQSAVEHLFRVVCGLDSQIVGEPQILGQVKDAYGWSKEAQVTGSFLHKLASRAFRIGKRARTETQIGRGAMSVGYAAVELAAKVFQDLSDCRVLVVGAGEHGALCADNLKKRGVRSLTITNRTAEKADDLASDLNAQTVPFEDLSSALEQADIVVTCTGADEPLISPEAVRRAMEARNHAPLTFLDVAVPRDVSPEVSQVRNVFRFDQESLDIIVEQNRRTRAKEVPLVENLVRQEAAMFMTWWEGLSASPMIKSLHEQFEAVRVEELRKHGNKVGNQQQLDAFTQNLVRKLLMGVTTEIKQYRVDNPDEMERLAVLKRLFKLDDEDEKE